MNKKILNMLCVCVYILNGYGMFFIYKMYSTNSILVAQTFAFQIYFVLYGLIFHILDGCVQNKPMFGDTRPTKRFRPFYSVENIRSYISTLPVPLDIRKNNLRFELT